MKLYELTTQCGAKIQTATLTKKESNPAIHITDCPVVCGCCGHAHGPEVCSVRVIEIKKDEGKEQ
jgi:hypothetical protein